MKLFDSHAHYDDSRFEAEYPGGADAAIRDSFEKGVIGIINAGTCAETVKSSISLAERYPGIYAAAGIHPSDSRFIDETDREAALNEIYSLALHEKVVAIGEVGLDYHYEGTDRKSQHYFFENQMKMAEELSLPVIVHDREAHGDTLDIVRRHKNVTGVFHSFSGSTEMAKELVRLGWYISFSGTVSFKNANRVREAARAVPLDRLLIETDCPYLAPHPHRGEINYSALLVHTAAALASAVGKVTEEIAEITAENTRRLFNIIN